MISEDEARAQPVSLQASEAALAGRQHVILILHGIRTQAEWAQQTAAVLETDPHIRAYPIRYEFFDLIRFLLPTRFLRGRPVRRFVSLLRDELSKRPEKLSVIAHSFGTYIVARTLEEEPDIHFHRLILCGSVVRDDFEWHKYGHRLNSDRDGFHVVNDCGMHDIWPVMAKSITWGYGSSGRFGFGHPRCKDRYFNVGHSGFFGREFVRDYWLPYLSRGEIVSGILDRPVTPWFVSILTIAKLRYLAMAVIVVSLIASVVLLTDVGAARWMNRSPDPEASVAASTPNLPRSLKLSGYATLSLDPGQPFEYTWQSQPHQTACMLAVNNVFNSGISMGRSVQIIPGTPHPTDRRCWCSRARTA